nr:MAG TPA: hypothetical protein [Caudoviricetes sp.]
MSQNSQRNWEKSLVVKDYLAMEHIQKFEQNSG